MQRLSNIPQWMDAIWLFLLAIYVLAGTAIVPFHGDESTLIYMGRDYYYQFIERDMSKVLYDDTWTISATEQNLRILNGTVSKYLYGWVTSVNGIPINDINKQWDWSEDYTSNQSSGRIPNNQLLIPARIVSTIQLVITVMIYFIVAQLIANRPTAYVSSLYLTLNPLILMNGRRAMMEGSHFLFMMVVILVGILLIRNHKWWLFILFGIASGFAVASKHPNAFIISLCFIALGSYIPIQIFHRTNNIRNSLKFIGLLFMSGLVMIFVFYLLNPAWWDNPTDRLSEVLTLRAELLFNQVNHYDSYTTISDRLQGFFEYIFIAQPQYFEDPRWATYPEIISQVQIYKHSIWSGLSIGGSLFGGLIIAILSAFGLFHFLRNPSTPIEYRWFVRVWGIGICVITLIVTPLLWARYYMPIYPFVGLMTAYSVVTLSNIFWKRFVQ